MLATDADLEIRARASTPLDGDLHQLPDPLLIEGEGITAATTFRVRSRLGQ